MPEVKEAELVTFDVPAGDYRHWRLTIDGRIATLAMDVNEDCGLKPGYKLKLNSYDLGVDIELHDHAAAHSLRASRSRLCGADQRHGAHVLRRRQHLHAGHLDRTPGR